MKIIIAAKRLDTKWEGALVANNAFQRAYVETELEDLVLRALAGVVLGRPHSDGTDVTFEISVRTPEEQAAEVAGGQKQAP